MTPEVNANERKRERLLEDVNPDIETSFCNLRKQFTIFLYSRFNNLTVS
jgi:hypothetical protein